MLATVGPVGVWIAAGLAVFKFLLTRSDTQAKQNMTELRRQLRDWKLRALRAELVVRAHQAAGHRVPRRELKAELDVHSELGDLGLFGSIVNERNDNKPVDADEPDEEGDT